MDNEHFYMVREFARLAGVTVRTLHFYDRANLLKPSRYTAAKHRLYAQSDLLRLQQILTLKYLGFALDEIRRLLDAPSYDLARALASQKSAIDEQIVRLNAASEAMGRMLTVAQTGAALDWREARLIIAGVVAEGKQAWLNSYFTPDQQAQLAARAASMTSEEIQAGTRSWQTLAELFNAKRHLPPDHAEVQALAAMAARLIEGFTQGDPAIAQSLRRMYENYEQIPDEMRLFDPELHQFMGAALDIYHAAQAQSDGE
jgi:MerR family transcriptional regulator, thiopeptide resistance regulator